MESFLTLNVVLINSVTDLLFSLTSLNTASFVICPIKIPGKLTVSTINIK